MKVLGQQAIRIFKVLYSLMVLVSGGHAEKAEKVSYFVSTRSKEVNLRRGPGKDYPIDWKIIKTNYPLLVIAQYETWRKVEDSDGLKGWVHQSMLTSKPRTGLVTIGSTLFNKPSSESRQIAHLEPKVFVTILEIKPSWCRVSVEGHRGWMQRSHLWGVLTNE